jgi:hypothetical protein
MGLTDDNGVSTTMLVGPTSAPYAQGNGFGNAFGGDGWWILLLFLLMGNNGWGGGFGGFGGGDLYPWMNQSNQINGGFRDQLINDNITEIRSGVTGLQSQLCNCCSDVQMALANGFAGVEQGANARQVANMQQAFAAQTAVTAGMNDIAAGLQNCCCENRANIADLKYTVATENCADRAALAEGIRDVIQATQAQTQTILNQMNQDKLDQKNDTINQLRQELLYSRGQASQDVQTAQLIAAQTAQTDAIYSRFKDCPVGTTPVYGQTPIFTCAQNYGCGCNNGCGCGM